MDPEGQNLKPSSSGETCKLFDVLTATAADPTARGLKNSIEPSLVSENARTTGPRFSQSRRADDKNRLADEKLRCGRSTRLGR